jgi:hypothetical protein
MFEWQLVPSPMFYPGFCIDGSQGGPNEGVIDTSIEFDGRRVYLPVRPVKQAARDLLGMVEAAKLVELEAKLATRDARIRELETELADAQPILAAMGRAAARYGSDD